MSGQVQGDVERPDGRIYPEFWEDKRFIAVPAVLQENPRRDRVAGWWSLQLIRQGGHPGISYRDWKDNMPTDIPNTGGTNHNHLKWDWEHQHIRVAGDDIEVGIKDRVRGKGAPPPQRSRSASVMENVGSTTYALKIFKDIELIGFKLGRAGDPKVRQELFNMHAMPELGGLCYVRFLEYSWPDDEDAHRMEGWLKRRFGSHREAGNSEIITGVTEGKLRQAWSEGIGRISDPGPPDTAASG